jgi:hypothetical protein
MPTQFSNSNSPVSVVLDSVLHGTNLYSTALICQSLRLTASHLRLIPVYDTARTAQKTAPIVAWWNVFTGTLRSNVHYCCHALKREGGYWVGA